MKQRDKKSCLMRLTGFGVAGRALSDVSKIEMVGK